MPINVELEAVDQVRGETDPGLGGGIQTHMDHYGRVSHGTRGG